LQRAACQKTHCNIISQCKESLIAIVTTGLEITPFFEDDEGKLEDTTDEELWSVSHAAAQLLASLSQLLGDEIWQPICDFS